MLKGIPHWADKLLLPRTGPLGLEISFLMPHLILMPLTFGLAELTYRFIDTPSVKFASWLYKKAVGESPGKQARS